MILYIIKNGVIVDSAKIIHFVNVPVITIMTPTGPNTYRTYMDRTEWEIGPTEDIVRVHVVTE